MIQVYTGDGKGKTTAALGQALRALGHGMKVYMIQFMKGRTYGELIACEQCLPDFTMVMSGRDEFVTKGSPEEIDIRMAREGFELAQKVVEEGRHNMLILDQINVAVDYGLLPLDEVLDFLRSCPVGDGGCVHRPLRVTGAYGAGGSGERGQGRSNITTRKVWR